MFFLCSVKEKCNLSRDAYLMNYSNNSLIDLTIRWVIVIIKQFKTASTSRAFEIIQIRHDSWLCLDLPLFVYCYGPSILGLVYRH